MHRTNIRMCVIAALFAGVTAIAAQIVIPIGPVPISMATLAVFISGGLLGAKWGLFSQAIYLLLGAFGAPVFHLFTGGLGVLTGPTGGFLAGYPAAAFCTGLILRRFGRGTRVIVAALLAGAGLCYLLGTAWYMCLTGTGLLAALLVCVLPFLIGDGLKVALATVVIHRLYRYLPIHNGKEQPSG